MSDTEMISPDTTPTTSPKKSPKKVLSAEEKKATKERLRKKWLEPVLGQNLDKALAVLIKKIQAKTITDEGDLSKNDKYHIVQCLFGDDKDALAKLNSQMSNHSKLEKSGTLGVKLIDLLCNQFFSHIWWEVKNTPEGEKDEESFMKTSLSARDITSWNRRVYRLKKELKDTEQDLYDCQEKNGYFSQSDLDDAIKVERDRSFHIWEAEKIQLTKRLKKKDKDLADLKRDYSTGHLSGRVNSLENENGHLKATIDEYEAELKSLRAYKESQDSSCGSGESVAS